MKKPLSPKEKKFVIVRALKLERNARKRNKYNLNRRKKALREYERNKSFREMAKNVTTYNQAVNIFMPKNLKYLISYEKSPIFVKEAVSSRVVKVAIIRLPKCFSILSNPKETYDAIKSIVNYLVCQKCSELWIDYCNCESSDLITQIFLDSILRDWDIFIDRCIRANLVQFIKVGSIGGRNYFNPSIQRMLNSVGSPTILLKRHIDYNQIIPFNLRFFDHDEHRDIELGAANEVDTTLLLEYVNKCLNRICRELTDDAADALGTVIGETVINASEHSSLKSRYMIGYFEDLSEENTESKHGILNLVILNYGQSIYEKFKYPKEPADVNYECIKQMKELSDLYVRKGFFIPSEFKESTLWTLYALQQGVTIIPNANRGNGTIQFIDKFFALGEHDKDKESRMYLLSGNTIIEIDGTYKLDNIADGSTNRMVMAFNRQGTLREKPDKRYVKFSSHFFPGTAIYARIVLNSSVTQNETN